MIFDEYVKTNHPFIKITFHCILPYVSIKWVNVPNEGLGYFINSHNITQKEISIMDRPDGDVKCSIIEKKFS